MEREIARVLLASTAGEAENDSGLIKGLRCASNTCNSSVTLQNWIIPAATTFVHQVPWIENHWIMNNTLVGILLPAYAVRNSARSICLDEGSPNLFGCRPH